MPILLKTVAVAAGLLLGVVLAGLSGATFFLWPTSVADRSLQITPANLDQLAKLKAERKFVEDKEHLYFGAPSEVERAKAQAAVDAAIERLQAELPTTPRRSVVLGIFKEAQASFPSTESEERDQFLVYLERIMGILGISSSGELFKVWRYGFPYGWFLQNGRV